MATHTISPDYLKLIRRFPLRPIRSEGELDSAIAVVNALAVRLSDLTTDERDYLEVLGHLVEKYEEEIYPEPDIAPHEMLREMLDLRGITQADLSRETGIRESIVSEILCGKRKMGRKTIATFARYFHVEPGVFFDDAEVTGDASSTDQS
jgi:HTH-type transcriptional regulator/antitoxin HigA